MLSISCKSLIPWNQEINHETNYSSQLTLIFLKLKNKGLNLSQCLIGRSSHINSKDRTTFHTPIIITHSPPGDFDKKMHFEASQAVFWSLSCYKELKPTTKPFTGHTLQGLLFQMQNISLRSLGMHRKQNFEMGFGFKSDIVAVLTFTFCFLSSPFFFTFLASFFFSCWALSRLHFGGKSF